MHKEKWGDNMITKSTHMFLYADLIFITVIIIINLMVVAVKNLDFTTALIM